jgi:rSAM/selenodomain-associated transferase 1
MTDAGGCAIAVMAKVPQAGRSKTRLCPPLLPEQAAALSAAFLRDVTENIAAAAIATGGNPAISGYVAYAPAGLEPLFAGHLATGTRLILADGTGEMTSGVLGFGRCLLHAIRTLLDRGHRSACVLNSDSPTLPTAQLRRAAELLAAPGDRVVLGPADDGGYYLLGLKEAHAFMFADIVWSTGDVAERTRDRARAAALELIELDPWYDVDDAPSLRRLMAELDAGNGPPDAFAAPASRACLRTIAPDGKLPS